MDKIRVWIFGSTAMLTPVAAGYGAEAKTKRGKALLDTKELTG